MDERKSVLFALRRAFRQEAHTLVGSAVGRHPQLVWQQLYNRLSEDGRPDGQLGLLLALELEHRSTPGAPPWICMRPLTQTAKGVSRTLEIHGDWVTDCAVSRMAGAIASSGRDGMVYVSRIDSFNEPTVLAGHHGWVNSVDISDDGSVVVSAGDDDTVRVWRAESGTELQRIEGLVGRTRRVALTADGRILACGGESGVVTLLDVDSCSELATWPAHEGEILALQFGPGGLIASSGSDGFVNVWYEDGNRVARFEHEGVVTGCGFVNEGATIVSAGWDGTVKEWSLVSGRQERLIESPGKAAVECCAARSDGSTIVFGTDAAAVCVVDASGELKVMSGHGNAVSAVALAPHGLVVSASRDRSIIVWAPSEEDGRPSVRTPPSGSPVTTCGFDQSGTWLVTGEASGRVAVWDVRAEKLHHVQKESGDPVAGCGFGSDEEIETLTHAPRGLLQGIVTCVAFDTQTGRRTFGLINGKFELPGGTQIRMHDSAVTCCAFDPEGWFVVSGDESGHTIVWDWRSHKRLAEHSDAENTPVVACAASRDGAIVAMRDTDGIVTLWDWEKDAIRERYHMRYGGRAMLAFKPRSTLLATCGDDRFVEVWATLAGAQIGFLPLPVVPSCIAFTADGARAAIGDTRGGVRLLDLVNFEGPGLWDAISRAASQRLSERALVLVQTGRSHEARAFTDGLLGSARRRSDRVFLAERLSDAGIVRTGIGDLPGALDALGEQERLLREEGRLPEVAGAVYNQAVALAKIKGPVPETAARAMAARDAAKDAGALDLAQMSQQVADWVAANSGSGNEQ